MRESSLVVKRVEACVMVLVLQSLMCYNDRRREEASYAALADVVIAPV